jgi:ComF family protein
MTPFLKKILSCLADLLFPPACLLCGEYLENGVYVCGKCLENLPLNRNSSKSSLSVFDYGEDIRLLIHELKYNHRPEIGIIMGEAAGKRLKGFIEPDISVLVPIPLHKKRLRIRGYNQTELICKGLSGVLNVPVKKDLLQRIRNNVSQTTLNAVKRSGNVKGIFGIDKPLEDHDKLILMVDDVITTGATTKEAGSVLKNSGYENVFPISIATVK